MKLTYEDNFKSEREDGRFTSSLAAQMEMLRHYKPILRLPDELTPEIFADWRDKVKNKTEKLLSLPERTPQPAPKLLSSVQRDGYRAEKWELYPDSYSAVPFFVLVPDGASAENKAPAVFCLPGAITSKEWLAGEPIIEGKATFTKYPERNHMAKHYAENGIVAFAFDHPEQCECSVGEMRGRSSMQYAFGCLQYGGNYVGMQVFPLLLAIEFAKTFDFIDTSRLALSAHSLGTLPAAMLGLISDDIKAIVFNDFVCDTMSRFYAITELDEKDIHQFVIEWNIVPGFWRWLSVPDLLAALAPKYLACNEGGEEECLCNIRRAYVCLGVPENLMITHYPKYKEADARVFGREMPKYGLTVEEYYARCYVDAPDHSFRPAPSLALLKECFYKQEK